MKTALKISMKNTMSILILGVITQIIFWSFISPLVGASSIRGLDGMNRKLNEIKTIPCNPGTNGTSCVCPNTQCLKYIAKTGGCHPIDCWKWNEIKTSCEEAGKEFLPAIILQGLPITGMFGSGFGNMGRWDIFATFWIVIACWCGCTCCLACCASAASNADEKTQASILGGKCGNCLGSIALSVMWIWGIVVIANKEVNAPWFDWEGNHIMCPLVG